MNRLWISLIAVCVVTPAAVSQTRPVIQASTATTRPAAGRWRYWTRCDLGYVVGQETGGLWFKADKLLWRYDLKTGEIRSLSPVDDISAITGPNALVPGSDYVGVHPLFFARRVFLPGRGWIKDPRLRGHSYGDDYLLDPKGNLVVKVFMGRHATRQIFRYDRYATNWHAGATLPAYVGLLPLANGYLLHGTGPSGGHIPRFYDLQGNLRHAISPEARYFTGRVYRVGDKTYAVFRKGAGNSQHYLYDVTYGRLIEKARGEMVGPDLAGKGFLTGRKMPPKVNFRKIEITLPDGSTIETPLLPPMGWPRLCRDANGHVWLNAYRWNGKRWDLVIPREHHFPLRSARAAMFPRLVRLDDKGQTWIVKSKGPDLSPHVFAFDSASKTGWTREPSKSTPFVPFVLRLHRFADGKRKTLATLPASSHYRPNFIRDAQGQWWWMGYKKPAETDPFRRLRAPVIRGVFRLSGLETHFYPIKRPPESGFPGFLFYGASKKMWLCGPGEWSFWDASADKFVPGEPWKEFALPFGPWKLSLVANRRDLCRLPVFCQQNLVSSLRIKKGDSWVPLADPFDKGDSFAAGRIPKDYSKGHLFGAHGMIWKDRMLVRSREVGIFEYDVTRDRWAYLHPWPVYDAFFDPAGRRMLVCGVHVLVYDGDPFEALGVAPAAKDIAEFRKLLKLMDDRRWQVRERAAQKMREAAGRHALRLWAALMDSRISEEVRSRIEWVLEEARRDKTLPPKPGKSLYYQMYPLPEFMPLPAPKSK